MLLEFGDYATKIPLQAISDRYWYARYRDTGTGTAFMIPKIPDLPTNYQ